MTKDPNRTQKPRPNAPSPARVAAQNTPNAKPKITPSEAQAAHSSTATERGKGSQR